MQAPRNWRTKVERYRLTGSENNQGEKSIVDRPQSLAAPVSETQKQSQPQFAKANAA